MNIIVRLPNNIKTFSKNYIETNGIVYGYKEEFWHKNYVYCMIIRYTINGNTYELVENFSSSIRFRPIGSKVKLKYHKEDITDAYIVYDKKTYCILLVIILMICLILNN